MAILPLLFPFRSNGYDLNRNFPDPVRNAGQDLRLPLATTSPEARAIMNFTLGRVWAGAANFHEGAEVGYLAQLNKDVLKDTFGSQNSGKLQLGWRLET